MKSYLVISAAILGIAYADADYSKCPQNEIMNNDMREKVTDMHNAYRSKFARDHQASKMRKLVYDCAIEKGIYESDTKCEMKPSMEEENVEVIDGNSDDLTVISEAGNSWWSEILDLKGKDVYNSVDNTSEIANMAWESHAKLGCAVVECSKKTHVVCRYGPEGKGEGKKIYEKGETCSQCSDYGQGVTCDNDEWEGLLCS
uniref:Secreted protein 3 n=1 Tax=Ancylostoma caninum TaxID=29170 RepID=Q86GK7_ANCCA|nr:secreted protein 3 precursor [Ancylostoma caninum]